MNIEVENEPERSLTELLQRAGIQLSGGCAGKGLCCHCAVELLCGTFKIGADVLTVEPGDRIPALACKTMVCSGEAQIAISPNAAFVRQNGGK